MRTGIGRTVYLFALLLVAASCSAAVRLAHGNTAWIVAKASSDLDRRTAGWLVGYVNAVLGKKPVIVSRLAAVPPGSPAFLLLHGQDRAPVECRPPAGSPEAFCISNGSAAGHPVIVLRGTTGRGLKRAVQRLIIASRQEEGALSFPALAFSEKPWIPQREWSLCPWTPQHVRGVFVNPYADNRMNVWVFSDAQLASYADMLDWFGFSGVQLIENSYG